MKLMLLALLGIASMKADLYEDFSLARYYTDHMTEWQPNWRANQLWDKVLDDLNECTEYVPTEREIAEFHEYATRNLPDYYRPGSPKWKKVAEQFYIECLHRYFDNK